MEPEFNRVEVYQRRGGAETRPYEWCPLIALWAVGQEPDGIGGDGSGNE
jgi:hypothetical protein